MRLRQVRYEPIVPAVDGAPPRFVVTCLAKGCTYRHDVHGENVDEALADARERHDPTHMNFKVQAVDYTKHPLYNGGA